MKTIFPVFGQKGFIYIYNPFAKKPKNRKRNSKQENRTRNNTRLTPGRKRGGGSARQLDQDQPDRTRQPDQSRLNHAGTVNASQMRFSGRFAGR